MGRRSNSDVQEKALHYATRCVERNIRARRPREFEWSLNVAYLAGLSDLEPHPVTGRPIPSGKYEKAATNPQVAKIVRAYVSKLVASRPVPQVIPISNSKADRSIAKVSGDLLLHNAEITRRHLTRHAMGVDAAVFGNGIAATQMNMDLSEEIEATDLVLDFQPRSVGPEGPDPFLGFEEKVDERRIVIRHGLPDMRAVSSYDFYPNPAAKELTVDKCQDYAERKLAYKHVIATRFNVDPDRLSASTALLDTFSYGLVDEIVGFDARRSAFLPTRADDMCDVWDFYHAPIVNKALGLNFPRGFRLIFSGTLVIDLVDELPYGRYPHVMYRDHRFPHRFWGRGTVDFIRRKQDTLDKIEDSLVKMMDKVARVPMILPYGVDPAVFGGEAGEVYNKQAGDEDPHPMQVPAPPAFVREMRNDAIGDIASIALSGAPMGGSTPERGSTGEAWKVLVAEQQSAMSMTFEEMEGAFSEAAYMELRLLKDHLPVPYVFSRFGEGKLLDVVEFDARQIPNTRVRITPGSMKFSYPHEKNTLLQQLIAQGAFTDPQELQRAKAHLLGEEFLADVSEPTEPGDRAVTRDNIARISSGLPPFFAPWMDHEECIMEMLSYMRSPRFWQNALEIREGLEQLLRQHQEAIAPPAPPGMEEVPMGGAQGMLGGSPGGAEARSPLPGRGVPGLPPGSNGFTGEMGAGKVNPMRVVQGQR